MIRCSNCQYYLPVDVFKGSCKLTKEPVVPEDKSCDKFVRIPKCRFCSNYTPETEFLGKCQGKVLAYPDMIAVNCSLFEWYTRN